MEMLDTGTGEELETGFQGVYALLKAGEGGAAAISGCWFFGCKPMWIMWIDDSIGVLHACSIQYTVLWNVELFVFVCGLGTFFSSRVLLKPQLEVCTCLRTLGFGGGFRQQRLFRGLGRADFGTAWIKILCAPGIGSSMQKN